jgi:hypothetical protein
MCGRPSRSPPLSVVALVGAGVRARRVQLSDDLSLYDVSRRCRAELRLCGVRLLAKRQATPAPDGGLKAGPGGVLGCTRAAPSVQYVVVACAVC